MWFKKKPKPTKEELLRKSIEQKLATLNSEERHTSKFSMETNGVIVENLIIDFQNDRFKTVWEQVRTSREDAQFKKHK